MSLEILDLLARFNLAFSAAAIIVLCARAPVRRWFGARTAYGLWLTPVAAGLAALAPARKVEVLLAPRADVLPNISGMEPIAAPNYEPLFSAGSAASKGAEFAFGGIELPMLGLALWIIGVSLSIAVLAIRQVRFVSSLGRLDRREEWGERVFCAESDAAGPAVIGVINPIIVAPTDFEARYEAHERAAVLAHERAHMAQGDPIANAAAALLQCVNWFNPIVFFAARAMRADQELACDEAVVGANTTARRAYAETMLKAHAGAQLGPLACGWPERDVDFLKERIAMLKRTLPTRMRRTIGASLVALATVSAGVGAWVSQPVDVAYAEASTTDLAMAPGEPWGAHVDRVRAEILAQFNDAEHTINVREDRVVDEENEQRVEERRRVVIDLDDDHGQRQTRVVTRVAAVEAEVNAALELELEQFGREMSQHGAEIARIAMSLAQVRAEANVDEAEAARLEALIEAEAARLEEIGARLEQRVEAVQMRLQVDVDGLEGGEGATRYEFEFGDDDVDVDLDEEHEHELHEDVEIHEAQ